MLDKAPASATSSIEPRRAVFVCPHRLTARSSSFAAFKLQQQQQQQQQQAPSSRSHLLSSSQKAFSASSNVTQSL
ncbi:putative zinc metalloprotease EGY3,chloroplastic [Trichinella pseudospiralis]